MTNAILNAGAATADLTTTPGQWYVLGFTGEFGGGGITLSANMPSSLTDFAALGGGAVREVGFRRFPAPGTVLKLKLSGADSGGATTSINAEITPIG